ncbi:MAG: glycosyltransferase family 2 protein [Clostridiales bacterium]|nr:glycosyltransferase family 2 protein [Clostridiales bacterium]
MPAEKAVSTLSLGVIALNEEGCLSDILADIAAQDYPHEKMEILLVDGGSADGTKRIMEAFARENPAGFHRILVLDNPKKRQPAGWNVALRHARGDVIFRVDAHASIPADFVSKNMERLNRGEMVSGGPRPNMAERDTPVCRTLLMAEASMFGSSVASYRRQSEPRYVNSLFHGAYRREVFETVGGFNEHLWRTEDNEVHYRIRQAGFKLCYDPAVVSYQHTRNQLGKMLKQKYGNGLWVGLTLPVCPGCLSLFHFVPFAFILAILLTTVLAFLGFPFLAGLMWAAYGLLAAVMTVKAILEARRFHISNLLLPFLFLLLHLSYGAGTAVGFCRLPFWLKKTGRAHCPEIEEVKAVMRENHGRFYEEEAA